MSIAGAHNGTLEIQRNKYHNKTQASRKDKQSSLEKKNDFGRKMRHMAEFYEVRIHEGEEE